MSADFTSVSTSPHGIGQVRFIGSAKFLADPIFLQYARYQPVVRAARYHAILTSYPLAAFLENQINVKRSSYHFGTLFYVIRRIYYGKTVQPEVRQKQDFLSSKPHAETQRIYRNKANHEYL